MKHGTLQFYSTVASLFPLGLITYILTLRGFMASWRVTRTSLKRGTWVTPETGCVWLMFLLAPPAALLMGIAGEVACLIALFTGHPSSLTQVLVILGLVAMALAICLHALALAFAFIEKEPPRSSANEAEPKPDN